MQLALEEARRAESEGEVPIGAVIVRTDPARSGDRASIEASIEMGAVEIVARAHNLTRTLGDPTAHAELLCVREAARATGYQRLTGCTVYTTVEPCFMCAGALSHARVERVVWGVRDPKFGGCASIGDVLSNPRLNHAAEIAEGVCADEARELLLRFFRSLRGHESEPREPEPEVS